MKTRFALLVSFLMFAAVACEDENDGTVWNDPHYIRVNVTAEKLIDQDGRNVSLSWAQDDSLRLFDYDKKGATIKTNNYTDSNDSPEVFFSYGWTAGSPYFAARPATDNVVCTDEGVQGVVVAGQQKAYVTGEPGVMPSMGKVTGNRSAYRLDMKSAAGMVMFAMNDSTVNSVKIEAVGGEPVGGLIDVNYAMLENEEAGFWTLSEGTEGYASIEITPAEGSSCISADNTFYKGSYYAGILSQNYSQGLKLTARFKDGTEAVQVIPAGEDGLLVSRSGIVAATKTLDDTLPDEFTVVVDFSSAWPFNEDIVPAAQQDLTKGETYTLDYTYMNGESELTETLDFLLYGNKKNYTYTAPAPDADPAVPVGYLNMGTAGNTRITIPAIYGRYLKAVKLEVNNAYAKKYALIDSGWNIVYEGSGATNTKPAEVTFPDGEFTPASGASYYFRLVNGSTQITKLSLTYSTTLN